MSTPQAYLFSQCRAQDPIEGKHGLGRGLSIMERPPQNTTLCMLMKTAYTDLSPGERELLLKLFPEGMQVRDDRGRSGKAEELKTCRRHEETQRERL